MIVRFILRSRKVSLVVQGDDHPPHEWGDFRGIKSKSVLEPVGSPNRCLSCFPISKKQKSVTTSSWIGC